MAGVTICEGYDLQLKAKRAVAVPTCIIKKPVLTGLITAPGGHIGRTVRIHQVALPAGSNAGPSR